MIQHFISKDKNISTRNNLFMHPIKDDSVLRVLMFVSKYKDRQVYGKTIHDAMVSKEIMETTTYETYLTFATGKAIHKKAGKRTKAASTTTTIIKESSLTVDDNIISRDPDVALELAKSMSKTKMKNKKQQDLCMRLMNKPLDQSQKLNGVQVMSEKERLVADTKKAIKASKLGSRKGAGLKPEVLDDLKIYSDDDEENKHDNDETQRDEYMHEDEYVHTDDDERTESNNEDQAMDDAKKNDEDKAEEGKDSDQEPIQDEQAKIEVAGVLVSMTHKEKPKLLISTSSQSVSSNYVNQFLITSPESPLLDVLASVVPPTLTNLTPSPILTTSTKTTSKAPTSTSVNPESETFFALQLRVSDLEKEIKELKQVDLSTTLRASIRSEPKSTGKSLQAEETVFAATDTDMLFNKVEDMGNTDEQPDVEVALKLNDLANAKNPPLTIVDLMSTPIDFSAFAMNCLKISKLAKADLVGTVYNLLKGTCQLTVPVDFFFNNDLKYLKGGSTDRKYTTSITKTKAAMYDVESIEDMVSKLWSPIKMLKNLRLGYNKDMKRRKWTETYQKRTHIMIKYINQQLLHRRIMRSLENQNQRDLPRDIPLDRIEVLRVLLSFLLFGVAWLLTDHYPLIVISRGSLKMEMKKINVGVNKGVKPLKSIIKKPRVSDAGISHNGCVSTEGNVTDENKVSAALIHSSKRPNVDGVCSNIGADVHVTMDNKKVLIDMSPPSVRVFIIYPTEAAHITSYNDISQQIGPQNVNTKKEVDGIRQKGADNGVGTNTNSVGNQDKEILNEHAAGNNANAFRTSEAATFVAHVVRTGGYPPVVDTPIVSSIGFPETNLLLLHRVCNIVDANNSPKSFENMLKPERITKKINFCSLINEENVVNSDLVLPKLAKEKFGLHKVMRIDNGVFLFKFSSSRGIDQVLERGLWLIRKSPIILTKWSPSLPLKKGEVTKGHIGFARALIEVSTESILKNEVIMAIPDEEGDGHSREVIHVEYEWKLPHCVECKCFGHDFTTPKDPTRASKSTSVEENEDGKGESSKEATGYKKGLVNENVNGNSSYIDDFVRQKKDTNKSGADLATKGQMDTNSSNNKAYDPSTSNSFDVLNKVDTTNKHTQSTWNEDLESDDEVDEAIFPEVMMDLLLEPTSNKPCGSGFNSLVHSLRALFALRRSGLRTASTAAKSCQGDSLELYLITGSIHTDQRGTMVLATLFNGSEQRHFRSFITNINLQESRRLQLLAKRTSIHNSMPTLQTHHR
nr:hypothetical protein [Tanacetum cinerariifolium]